MLASLLVLSLAAAPPAATEVDRLAWLAGCWVQVRPNGKIEEQWLAPAGGMMLGMSRSVRDGKLREYEFLRIAPGDDGKTRYIADPSGQPEAAFTLKEITDTSVLFENPDHDFPQRIRYMSVDPQTLVARIEGSVNGQARAVDFPYKRCQPGN